MRKNYVRKPYKMAMSCTNNASPRASFLWNKEMPLAERGYIAMNNTIKVKDVGIFYPFPVVAVG